MEITEAVTSIRRQAEQIGRDLDALDAAGAAVLTEKALILSEVIKALGPALRALSSPVSIEAVQTSNGTSAVPGGWRGVFVAGDGPKTDKGDWIDFAPGASGKRGRYIGTRLILRQDGKLVELAYDGPWSSVPGEISKWKAEERVISEVEAVKLYGLDAILLELSNATRQAARTDKPGPNGFERRGLKLADLAERLRAVCTIIRAWTL